jgi:polysaccharide transporter, PST family
LQVRKLSALSIGLRDTLQNIGWMSFEKVMRLGGALLVGTWVVRYLGPEQYGAFSYAFALFALFNTVSNLGLDYLVVRDIALASDVQSEAEILGTSFLLKAAASAVTTIAAISYAYLTHPKDTTTVVIVAMLSVAGISQGFDVIDYFFQAKTRSRLAVLPQMVVFVMMNAARILAVLSKCSILIFGLIAALEILSTELVLAFVYFHHHRNIRLWSFDKKRARSLLNESWPLVISSLLVMIYMRTDQILLGTLSTNSVVGQYSAAVKLSEIWYAIPSVICASVMPRLLKYRIADPALYYSRLQRLYDTMAISSLVLALAISFTGKYLILVAFGHAYMPAARILIVHIWTGPFVFLGVVGGNQLIHEGLTKLTLQRSIVGAFTNVGLNYLLIPRLGGIGSALATLLAQCLSAYLCDAMNKSTRHIFLMKTKALLCLWLFKIHPFRLRSVGI